VVFSSTDSYDIDGAIVARKWYINGVYQTSSTTLSKCFILNGAPGNGCYELAAGLTTVSIKLEVQDNAGEWSAKTTSYTIQDYKRRKYFVTDHIGTIRATVDIDGNVLGYDDYYPFGLTMPGRSSNSANPNDQYKFTGHERDDEADLTLDYMGARYYDPDLVRFYSIDPYAAKFPNYSPYNYALNNPIMMIDPDGRAATNCCMTDYGAGRYYSYKKGGKDGLARYEQAQKASAAGTLTGIAAWVAPALVSHFGTRATLSFLGNEAKDEVLSQATGGLSDVVDVSKALTKFGKEGISALLQAGNELDRNNLTNAARALQKHGSREGSAFPNVSGKELNEKGNEILEGILNSDNQLIRTTDNGGSVIFDQNTGRGVAYTKDGKFNGFRELELEE
jgi:RHS repeat-associated protein